MPASGKGAPRALVFGVTGQDGAYLARSLTARGAMVIGAAQHVDAARRGGLEALGVAGRVALFAVDVADAEAVAALIGEQAPDEVYNLAGQSSVAASFAEPEATRASIVGGTRNILEGIRTSGRPIRLFSAGSSDCFADTGEAAADEATPFDPRSPYAEAKAEAHALIVEARGRDGLFACTGHLFNHESPLRPERFVTRKVAMAAARIAGGDDAPLTLGDLSVRRDWGWAGETVEAMRLMLAQDAAEDFVIATGESGPLEDFVAAAFEAAGLDWRDHVRIDSALMRRAEPRCGRGDPSRAAERLGWRARRRMRDVAARMVGAEIARRDGAPLAPHL